MGDSAKPWTLEAALHGQPNTPSADFGVVVEAAGFGAVGDGVHDDTLALRAAYESAAGRPIVLAPGRFKVTAPITGVGSLSLNLRGAGIGQTILVQSADQRVIDIRGSDSGSAIALTANAAVGDTTLTLVTTGLAVGDYCYLKSTVAWPGSLDSAVYGEIVRIMSVDSGTQVTLYGQIDESYATADTSTLTKISYVANVHISDLTIENSAPDTRTAIAMYLDRVREITLERVKTFGLDGSMVRLKYALNWVVDNCRFVNHTDNPGASRYGYGVEIGAYSRDGIVSNCFMRQGRHLVTTGASTGEGPPRHITISSCIATEVSAAAFDTHEEGRYIHFADCLAHNTRHRGFNTRALDVSYAGCRAYGLTDAGAVRVDANAIRCKITDFIARDGERVASTQEALSIAAPDCQMSNVYVEDWDGAAVVLFGTADRAKINGLSAINVGRFTTSARYAVQMVTGADEAVLRNIYFESTLASAQAIKVPATCTGWTLNGLVTKMTGGTSVPLSIDPASPGRIVPGSIQKVGAPGTSVAAAATTTLPDDDDFITITGNTNITAITASYPGRIVRLLFTGTPTVTDGSNLKMAGNLVATADDTLSLVCDGTNWYETARAVN